MWINYNNYTTFFEKKKSGKVVQLEVQSNTGLFSISDLMHLIGFDQATTIIIPAESCHCWAICCDEQNKSLFCTNQPFPKKMPCLKSSFPWITLDFIKGTFSVWNLIDQNSSQEGFYQAVGSWPDVSVQWKWGWCLLSLRSRK